MKRLALIISLSFLAGWGVFTVSLTAQGEPIETAWIFSRSSRIAKRVDASNVQIQVWAAQIRKQTLNPMQRAALAEKLVAEQIRYTDSSLIDGIERIPSVADVTSNRQGNCEAQTIVLASLWQALGFDVEIQSRADHAWPVLRFDHLKDFNFLPK